ncbi:hypothetical protein E2P81_ATG05862 [Venturia nashicola]|nr:hypothetical protein E2P81_ATG05862 [Venturia nashicola]
MDRVFGGGSPKPKNDEHIGPKTKSAFPPSLLLKIFRTAKDKARSAMPLRNRDWQTISRLNATLNSPSRDEAGEEDKRFLLFEKNSHGPFPSSMSEKRRQCQNSKTIMSKNIERCRKKGE